tara:strand:+ start:1061 stop:1837 length:777 start_codon:yes stop_codon:yes gene_type:complete
MITLFNNEKFELDDILEKMIDDKFYYGHLGDKVLSYSNIKMLLESPKKFKYVMKYGSPETQALRDGKLVHTAVLEPHKISDLNFVDTSTKRTKKWTLAVNEFGKENTFTQKELASAERIADALTKNKVAMGLMNKAQTEVPAMKMFNGLPVRGKADILREDTVIDLKTTAVGIKNFEYVIDKYDYDLQAYLYTQLYDVPNFTFLVVDKGTLDIGQFPVGPETFAKGKAKFEAGLELYNAFFVEKYVDLNEYVYVKQLK